MKSLLPAALLLFLGCGDDDPGPSARDAEVAAPAPDAGKADAATPARDSSVPDAGRPPSDAGSAADARTETAEDAAAATDAGATGCTGLKFCDDFEDAQLGAGWTGKQGMIELDDTKAHSGKKSLHAHTVNGGASIIAHRASFPMPNERFWVRLFVNIKNLPTPDWAHWSMLWTMPEGAQWSAEEHRLGGQNETDDKLYWGVGTDRGPSGDWTNIDSSSAVALDTWQCVELFIDAKEDVSKVYREGVEIPKLGTTRTVKHQGNASVPYDIPSPRSITIGFTYHQGQTPNQAYDLWIDSFALDGERIGCAR
ncbi:MAG TPA: hypothetical protein VFX59_09655 [Polyangiales bacterium]|nr:hypothetical protein [Polyangiales bacterium]